jgi:hypothetical protein
LKSSEIDFQTSADVDRCYFFLGILSFVGLICRPPEGLLFTPANIRFRKAIPAKRAGIEGKTGFTFQPLPQAAANQEKRRNGAVESGVKLSAAAGRVKSKIQIDYRCIQVVQLVFEHPAKGVIIFSVLYRMLLLCPASDSRLLTTGTARSITSNPPNSKLTEPVRCQVPDDILI